MTGVAMIRTSDRIARQVLRIRPSEAQLEHLQAICQHGPTYTEIAHNLGVKPVMLRWWARLDDEAGDALRVAHDIRSLRIRLNV